MGVDAAAAAALHRCGGPCAATEAENGDTAAATVPEPRARPEDRGDIYFHRNSVAGDQYDRLEIGTRVRFEETMGRDGLQVTTVEILGKPGATPAGDDEPPERAEPPRDWQA